MRPLIRRAVARLPSHTSVVGAIALVVAAVAMTALVGCRDGRNGDYREGDRITFDNGYELVLKAGWRGREQSGEAERRQERRAVELVGPQGQWVDISRVTKADAREYMAIQETLIARGDSDGEMTSTSLWGANAVVVIGTIDKGTEGQQLLATLWGAGDPILLQFSGSDSLDEMVAGNRSAGELLGYSVDTIGLQRDD